MPSKVGLSGRKILQALARSLGIEDVKIGPNHLDVDDIKVVASIPSPIEYQEFMVGVDKLSDVNILTGMEIDLFAVGGVTENGQTASFQINCTNQTAADAEGGIASLATDWDYQILTAVVQVQLGAATALAENGNDLEPSFLLFVNRSGTTNQGSTTDPTFTANRFVLTRNNIGDGMTIDTDQLTYTFPIFFNQSDSQDASSTWRGIIPGIQGNGLRFNIWLRTGAAGALKIFGGAVQWRSRVYGIRYKKGILRP